MSLNKTIYFNCLVELSYVDSFWQFTITHNGTTHYFWGLPNKCFTRRSAFKRAWHRAKWLCNGTFNKRYL